MNSLCKNVTHLRKASCLLFSLREVSVALDSRGTQQDRIVRYLGSNLESILLTLITAYSLAYASRTGNAIQDRFSRAS